MKDEETGDLVETDVAPTRDDVYRDFDRIRSKAGISRFKAKFVKRRYVFGQKDVPRTETQWLKVVYGFNGTLLPVRQSLGYNRLVRAATIAECIESQLCTGVRYGD